MREIQDISQNKIPSHVAILSGNCNQTSLHGLKFVFSKKATKIDEIFTVDMTLCSKCQIVGEDFVNFCGLLRKYKL